MTDRRQALIDAVLLGEYYDCEPHMYESEAAFLANIKKDSVEHVVTAEAVVARVELVLETLDQSPASDKKVNDALREAERLCLDALNIKTLNGVQTPEQGVVLARNVTRNVFEDLKKS